MQQNNDDHSAIAITQSDFEEEGDYVLLAMRRKNIEENQKILKELGIRKV